MLAYDIVTLARAAERLRFRIDHHLGGDPGRLEGLVADLSQLNPWHPIALNDRARRALPESWGPPMSPAIAESARAFQAGRLTEALDAARGVEDGGLVRADLAMALDRLDQAEEELAALMESWGPLPVVRARKAALALRRRRPEEAWQEASRALAANPVYGTARELHGHAAQLTGRERFSLPVRSPVRFQAGHAHYPSTLSPRARAAWRAWATARAQQDLTTTPPGSVAHAALLAAWRAESEEPAFYREDPNTELEALDRWERQGLLAAYQWSTGLSFRNAEAFRAYRAAHADAMLAFWSEGVVQR